MILRIIFSTALIIILAGCSQGGWMGYYEMKSPAVYNTKVVYGYVKSGETNVSNWAAIQIKNSTNTFGIGLPRGCSGFMIAGFFTPVTPPIPIPNFRSLSFERFMGNDKKKRGQVNYQTNQLPLIPNKK